jgi:membrane protein implicated in regulation of membrane protease activity
MSDPESRESSFNQGFGFGCGCIVAVLLVLLLPILLPAVFGVGLASLGSVGVLLDFVLRYWYAFLAVAVLILALSYLARWHRERTQRNIFRS